MSDAIEVEGVVVDVHRGDLSSVDVQIGGTVHRVLARRSYVLPSQPAEVTGLHL